jgi:class 3 adenylate cyclase
MVVVSCRDRDCLDRASYTDRRIVVRRHLAGVAAKHDSWLREDTMTIATTVAAKYVFVDVVAFSRNRSVEAQADIIAALNQIVRTAISDADVAEDRLILLPTGDGICIALKNVDDPFDVHVLIALSILRLLDAYNVGQSDPRRQFEVRLGINANVDNLVTDIRGNPNVAGQGINLAQRIMSTADGNQVMVGAAVFEVLGQRETYDGAFRRYEAVAKHALHLPVYQLVAEGHTGLNVAEPSQFGSEPSQNVNLSRTAAFYIALAIQHEELLRSWIGTGQNRVAGIALLYFSAIDAESIYSATDPRLVMRKQPAGAETAPEQRFRYYVNLDFWLVCELATFVMDHVLRPHAGLFESHDMDFWFVSSKGRQKLHSDWPSIEAEFCTPESSSETASDGV